MKVIWDFLYEIFNAVDDAIRGDIKNDLFRAIAFLLFWLFIIAIPVLIIIISVPQSPMYLSKWIGLGIIIFIVAFEILCWIGKLVSS